MASPPAAQSSSTAAHQPKKPTKAEIERQAGEEAKRQALIQKAELARIRREMQPNLWKQSVVLSVLAVIGGALLIGGGYALYCHYSVNLWRRNFQEHLATVDTRIIRMFTPELMVQVDNLRQRAEQASALTESKAIRELYREAAEVLGNARRRADEQAESLAVLRREFQRLYDEAEELELGRYAPDIWQRVETLHADSIGEIGGAFGAEHVSSRLREAIAVLTRAKESYDGIRDYDAATGEYQIRKAAWIRDEWSQNLPARLPTLEVAITRAEAAVQAGAWADAAARYRDATAMLESGEQELGILRRATTAAVAAFIERLASEDTQALADADSATWQEIQNTRAKLEDAMDAHGYAAARETAVKGMTTLEQALGRLKVARETRAKELELLQETFRKASAFGEFFATNYPDAWPGVIENFRRLQGEVPAGHYVQAFEQARALRQRLEAMLEERRRLLASAAQEKQAFEELLETPDAKLLPTNLPAEWVALEGLRNRARRADQQSHVKSSAVLYAEARATLAKQVDALTKLRRHVQAQQREWQERRRRFQRGLTAFHSVAARQVEVLWQQIQEAVDTHDYRQAAQHLAHVATLLPTERFVARDDASVIDNELGIMWARDGNAAGGNGGETLNWYDALVWVNGLRFAGFEDWRLPTDIELRVLAELPADQRDTLFPNTRPAIHWTRQSETVDKALGVDFGTPRTVPLDKRARHFLRAVRSPL